VLPLTYVEQGRLAHRGGWQERSAVGPRPARVLVEGVNVSDFPSGSYEPGRDSCDPRVDLGQERRGSAWQPAL
jgi:hypothetical protein